MKKLIFLFVLGLAFSTPSVFGQTVVSTKAHKIVFHLTSSDTLVHKAMVKQINNALTAAPNAKGITELKAKGVVFAACENTLRERKIEKKDIVPEATFVPAGILEVAMKQEKGYSYIKAGF